MAVKRFAITMQNLKSFKAVLKMPYLIRPLFKSLFFGLRSCIVFKTLCEYRFDNNEIQLWVA